jgi:outer membrane protein
MLNRNILKYLGVAALVLNLNAEDIYTVDDLILKSLKNSPNLQISKSNYEASKSRYDSAYSGYLPTVDLSVSAGKSGQNDTFGGNPDTMIDDNLLLGTLSVKQIIYDFGKTGSNVDTQKYNSEALLSQNIQDISDKKYDVKKAYYNVLNSLALIEVQKENVKLNEAQLYRSQKYFEAGIRTKIDVSDAKVALIQSKLDLKKAEYALKLSYANLDQVAGFTALEQEYSVYSQELKLDSLYSSLINYDLDLKESIIHAYQNRALIKKQDVQIKSSMAQIDEISSEYYPALYLAADSTKQSVDKFKAFIPENKWQATVNLDWNIYAGGSTNARYQEKKINLNIANDTLNDLKLNIKKETTEAYINVSRNKDSVELSQSLLEVSAKKFNQASKRYEYGLSDYIELQQARQGYIDAKASLIVAYYDYYTAVAYLDNAIGK